MTICSMPKDEVLGLVIFADLDASKCSSSVREKTTDELFCFQDVVSETSSNLGFARRLAACILKG